MEIKDIRGYQRHENFDPKKSHEDLSLPMASLCTNLVNDGYNVIVVYDKHDNKYPHIVLDNGLIKLSIYEYRNNKIILTPIYDVPFKANVVFEHNYNDMFKYVSKTFKKHINFYIDAFKDLERLKNDYEVQMKDVISQLESKGAIKIIGDYSVDFILFGEFRNIYYKLSSDIVDLQMRVYFYEKEYKHSFLESSEFIENLEKGIITKPIDVKDIHHSHMLRYSMLRDLITVLVRNETITENHKCIINGDEFVLCEGGHSNSLTKNGEYFAITNIEIEDMYLIRNYLFEKCKSL